MMHKVINIVLSGLITFICVISGILALALIVIEGRLIFSLDWIVYENVVNAFIRYLFRFILAIFALGLMILDIINLYKKNEVISFYLNIFDFSLLLMSLFLLFFATNYIGIICLVLVFVKIVIKIIKLLLKKRSQI